MKLLIQKTNETKSNIKKIELTSSDFENNTNTYVIKENESPIIYLTDTQSSYFIDDIDSKLERVNSETVAIITMNDLISLGSGTGGDSRPYKVYTALLSQSGTDAPVVIVLENTLGNIVWSRDGNGFYVGTLSNSFPNEKTFCLIQNNYQSSGTQNYIYRNSNNEINIETRVSNISTDSELNQTSIEIRTYN